MKKRKAQAPAEPAPVPPFSASEGVALTQQVQEMRRGLQDVQRSISNLVGVVDEAKERLPPPRPPKHRLCSQCQHSVPDKGFAGDRLKQLEWASCGVFRDRVVGAPESLCKAERHDHGRCGPDGKFWAFRPEPPAVVLQQGDPAPTMERKRSWWPFF